MNWAQSVDIYCERMDASFWAEPVNAVTNAAFILAGLYWLMRSSGQFEKTLSVTLIAIGIGSFLFHTVAQRWAGLADVLPIFVFIALSTYGLFHRYLGWPFWKCLIATLLTLFISISVIRYSFDALALSLNGSENYFFAFVILLASSLMTRSRHPNSTRPLFAASGIFIVSLLCRTLDAQVCPILAIGTHFLWHILNALTLSLIILAFDRKHTLDASA